MEQSQPNATSPAFGRSGAIQSWVGHAFLLRLPLQQQTILCGLRLIARPLETNGHLVVMVTDAADERLEGFAEQFRAIITQIGDDPREPPEMIQGRGPAPPPPSGRNMRGPWG